MKYNNDYLIGVDGGGSGTRLTLQNAHTKEVLISTQGPPSALGQGIEKSWSAILKTLGKAFNQSQMPLPELKTISLGIGISGANNEDWKTQFIQLNPGFSRCLVETDGLTTFLGAHGGRPGSIVALGTGSVGLSINKNRQKRVVSGWGFPAGDEASGSWLGLRVASFVQKVFDHRETPTLLTKAVTKQLHLKGTDDFLEWLGQAKQYDYAQLAPLVFQCAPQGDIYAQKLIEHSIFELIKMVSAIDPNHELPLSVCGGLGLALSPFLTGELSKRNRPPLADSTHGALKLLDNNADAIWKN